MVTQIWASRFCCWTYSRASLIDSASSSLTLHSSKHTRYIWWHPTVVHPSGRAGKRFYSTRHSFCSWSYSLDSYLVYTSHIRAFVAIERICVDQCAFKGFASRFNDLDRKLFSPSSPHFSLLLLHQFLQLRSRGWRDENAGLPEISKPVPVLPPLLQPTSRFLPAFEDQRRDRK